MATSQPSAELRARSYFLFAAAAKRDTNCNKTLFYSSTMDLQRGTTLNYICPGFGSTSKPALGQVVGGKRKTNTKKNAKATRKTTTTTALNVGNLGTTV